MGCELRNRCTRPLVATPCYDHKLCMNDVISLTELNPKPDVFFVAGCSLIPRARNECVRHFLSGEWTRLFFIDADMASGRTHSIDS